MAAHVFNENGQMHEVEIPDIFDVLEGGEDEGAVKFLLGFAGDDESEQVRVTSLHLASKNIQGNCFNSEKTFEKIFMSK